MTMAKDPKALHEVRSWKAKMNKKVAHLPIEKAIKQILDESIANEKARSSNSKQRLAQ